MSKIKTITSGCHQSICSNVRLTFHHKYRAIFKKYWGISPTVLTLQKPDNRFQRFDIKSNYVWVWVSKIKTITSGCHQSICSNVRLTFHHKYKAIFKKCFSEGPYNIGAYGLIGKNVDRTNTSYTICTASENCLEIWQKLRR